MSGMRVGLLPVILESKIESKIYYKTAATTTKMKKQIGKKKNVVPGLNLGPRGW